MTNQTKIKTAMEHAADLVAEGETCMCKDRPGEPLTDHHWKCQIHIEAINRRRAG